MLITGKAVQVYCKFVFKDNCKSLFGGLIHKGDFLGRISNNLKLGLE